MADLSDINAAESVKIIGADSAGVESTPVQSTTTGALYSNLRNNSGTEIATAAAPLRTDPTGSTIQPVSAASLPLPTGAATASKQDNIIAGLQTLNSLVPTTYDYISLGYTGANLTTVIYKLGGSGGTTISTLTLAYSSDILQSVTKT